LVYLFAWRANIGAISKNTIPKNYMKYLIIKYQENTNTIGNNHAEMPHSICRIKYALATAVVFKQCRHANGGSELKH